MYIYLQSLKKYLRLTLVFMWNSTQMENLIAVFQVLSASINKTFILGRRLATTLPFYLV